MSEKSYPHLFEITLENRVVYKSSLMRKSKRPMRSRQGEWYSETISVMAENVVEAGKIAYETVEKRRILGRSARACRKFFVREIKIIAILEML